jgi:hypothetical protein
VLQLQCLLGSARLGCSGNGSNCDSEQSALSNMTLLGTRLCNVSPIVQVSALVEDASALIVPTLNSVPSSMVRIDQSLLLHSNGDTFCVHGNIVIWHKRYEIVVVLEHSRYHTHTQPTDTLLKVDTLLSETLWHRNLTVRAQC